jgi:2-hydroxychromene-2-carboxylate isomerase
MKRLKFFYEFASTYSYLSVMRAELLAKNAGVELLWRPFLLGPIFKSQGWSTSPFNLYPAKGRYMVRDIHRIAESRGLPFKMPAVFPANGLLAARIATAGEDEGWTVPFTKAVFEAQFGRGEDISSQEMLADILIALGLNPVEVCEKASSQTIKDRLRERTEGAHQFGVFGAPSFVTADGELFWGDDRFEQALTWDAINSPPDPCP